ncbi:MAG: hypothetical protein LHV68_02510 [Elusimicrobia bacterium]|nr:hypothetical protein [Candidatus Liberimonas magnetica]
MPDIDDDLILDRKTKELKYLQEILQSEMKKWTEREFELKDTIKLLEDKVPKLEAELKLSYEKRLEQLSVPEKEFLKIRVELEEKIKQQELEIGALKEIFKKKEAEFISLQKDKDEQQKDQEKHLIEQIKWLTEKLNNERESHAQMLKSEHEGYESAKAVLEQESLRVKQEIHSKEEELNKMQRLIYEKENQRAKIEFELRNNIDVLNEELKRIRTSFGSEKSNLIKGLETKQEEITRLNDALKNQQSDLVKQSEELMKQLKLLKSESEKEVDRLKATINEQAFKITEISQKVKHEGALEEGQKTREQEYESKLKQLQILKSESDEEVNKLKIFINEQAFKIDEMSHKLINKSALEEGHKAKEQEYEGKLKQLETLNQSSDEETKLMKKLIDQKDKDLFGERYKNSELEKKMLAHQQVLSQKANQFEDAERNILELKAILGQRDDKIKGFEKRVDDQELKISELSKETMRREEMEEAVRIKEKQIEGQKNQIDIIEKKYKMELAQKDTGLERLQGLIETQKTNFEEKIRQNEDLTKIIKKEKQKNIENEAKIRAEYEEKVNQRNMDYKKEQETWNLERSSLEQEKRALKDELKASKIKFDAEKADLSKIENAEWHKKLKDKDIEMDQIKAEITKKEHELKNKYLAGDRDVDMLKLQHLKWEKTELQKKFEQEKNKWLGKDTVMHAKLMKWKYAVLLLGLISLITIMILILKLNS